MKASTRSPGELAVASGVLAVGVLFAWATWHLPEAPGYSQVGPGVVPAIVSLGLLVCGAALLFEASRGGLRQRPAAEGGMLDGRALGLVILGLVLHAAFIGVAGFIAASTILFLCVARAFGSVRWLRDGAIGVVLAGALYWLFTQVLRLSLGPALGVIAL